MTIGIRKRYSRDVDCDDKTTNDTPYVDADRVVHVSGDYWTPNRNYTEVKGGAMTNVKYQGRQNDYLRRVDCPQLQQETVEFIKRLRDNYRERENANLTGNERRYPIGENDFYIGSLKFDELVELSGYSENHCARQVQLLIDLGYLDYYGRHALAGYLRFDEERKVFVRKIIFHFDEEFVSAVCRFL